MKIQKIKSGFTLIELLVVITIIGILATWAVNIFTSQLQKARDSTRISDLNTLRVAIEQYYQDASNYPTKWSGFRDPSTWIWNYIQRLPIDARTSRFRSATGTTVTPFDYLYNVWADVNLIPLQRYEISATFENDWNIASRAANSDDGWNDDYRLEIWVWVEYINTSHGEAIPSTVDSLSCVGNIDCDNAAAIMVIRR